MKTEDIEENTELNQARSKPDPVDQPVRTALTIVRHYIVYDTAAQFC